VNKELIVHGVLLSMLVGIVLITGCSTPIFLKSRWPENEITVDDGDDEWGSATMYVHEAKVSLTLINDSMYLYIRLHSRDRAVQMQMLGGGLTIWFDPTGKKKKDFGIHYPMRGQLRDMPIAGIKKPEHMEEIIAKPIDELEILFPEIEESHQFLLTAAKVHGIDAKLRFSKGNLIYELKVPLVKSEEHKYAIGINMSDSAPDSMISIGFETAELDREAMKEKMEQERKELGMEEPPEAGRMPPGGMPGEMPGGGPPGAGKMSEPINLWISVKLALRPHAQ
jgi:hypothetical protein